MTEWSWRQPFCDDCYLQRVPGREPYRIREPHRSDELCADCGTPTRSGIYLRMDPSSISYPTPEEKDK